ncbi:MAG: hypothetical protein H6Q69_2180 [Firmicutes bacterium]|nr:hypothetical protein [Bacillota bacterium]
MDRTVMKLEAKDYGFDFLDTILNPITGTQLDYAEIKGNIPKYKLSNLHPKVYDYFLKCHIEQSCNVCGYFDKLQNNVFVFNIDGTEKKEGDELAEDVKVAGGIITKYLRKVNIEPLVVLSGRGYHLWCRMTEPVDNEVLADFILRVIVRTLATMENSGFDKKKVNISKYPHDNEQQNCSLRLFGSKHVKNQVFSHIFHPTQGALSEADSWAYFKEHMDNQSITPEHLTDAMEKLKGTYFEVERRA